MPTRTQPPAIARIVTEHDSLDDPLGTPYNAWKRPYLEAS
jgi:hypothetical protein